MITQILITLILIGFNFNPNPKETVLISGYLINFSNRTTVDDISEISDLSYKKGDRELICDKKGFFSISFKLKEANYFLIGRNVIYLTPGDVLKVSIDFNKPDNSKFDGIGAEANNYLRFTPNPKSGSFLKGGLNLKKTPTLSLEYIYLLARKREQELKKLKKVSLQFKRLEKARITADIINSFKIFPGFFIMENGLAGTAKEEFNHVADSLIKIAMLKLHGESLLQSQNLKLTVFRKNIYAILSLGNKNNIETDKIKDMQNARELFYEIEESKNRSEIISINAKIDKIKNQKYINALKESLEIKMSLLNNDAAKDFVALDNNLNLVKLSSLKGKFIFINLWATWCGPCLDEMPRFNEIKEKYINNSKITFISLCVNDNKNAWRNYLDKSNQNGLQWFVEQIDIRYYRITSLPRTIIIDPNFNVFELYGHDLLDNNIYSYIDNLIKEK